MCISKLFNLFRKPKKTTTIIPNKPDETAILPSTLPHPEETMNHDQTTANTSISGVFQQWYENWLVPSEYWDYWRVAIDIQVYDAYPPSILSMGISPDAPGVSWGAEGNRHYACLAPWFNPGVTAHEQAHNSYALLTKKEKADFSKTYRPLINNDPYIVLLYSINKYGLTNDVEGHAEVYRYLGQYMPEKLKRFYPNLF